MWLERQRAACFGKPKMLGVMLFRSTYLMCNFRVEVSYVGDKCIQNCHFQDQSLVLL